MRIIGFLILLLSLSTPVNLQSLAGSSTSLQPNAQSKTRVVLLGTGTPNADPDRSGPAVAVVVNDTPYVIDCGPGVVRRAAAAARNGVNGLAVEKLRRLFITHLHSDHTAGLADFIFTPAVLERDAPLEIYGPPGIKAMTNHLTVRGNTRLDSDLKLPDEWLSFQAIARPAKALSKPVTAATC